MLKLEFTLLPIGPARLAARIFGGMMIFSTLLYGFFGLPLWAPVGVEEIARVPILIAVHVAGVIVFGLSFYRDYDSLRHEYERQALRVAERADKRIALLHDEMTELREHLKIHA